MNHMIHAVFCVSLFCKHFPLCTWWHNFCLIFHVILSSNHQPSNASLGYFFSILMKGKGELSKWYIYTKHWQAAYLYSSVCTMITPFSIFFLPYSQYGPVTSINPTLCDTKSTQATYITYTSTLHSSFMTDWLITCHIVKIARILGCHGNMTLTHHTKAQQLPL